MDRVDQIILANATPSEHILLIDCPELIEVAFTYATRVTCYLDSRREFDSLAPRDGYPTRCAALPPVHHPKPGLALVTELSCATIKDIDQAWLRIPKSLGALAEYAELLANYASPELKLIAGGKEKFLTRSMNDILAGCFNQVQASLGANKARALLADQPKSVQLSWPRCTELQLPHQTKKAKIWSHGATFSAGKLDLGTRLLLDNLPAIAEADYYADLGTGSGVISYCLAKTFPDSQVYGCDISLAAVKAAKLTTQDLPNVTIYWLDALAGFEPSSLDVICCNPPFHQGTSKASGPALAMFKQAGRVLSPGGEFWCVYNSHLPWRATLTKEIGPTQLVAQNKGYTLTRSVKPVS